MPPNLFFGSQVKIRVVQREVNSALESVINCVRPVRCHEHESAVILEQSTLTELGYRSRDLGTV